jgi:SAM-dependent methyltransferase
MQALNKTRYRVRELNLRQVLRGYARGLALLIKRPGLARELQAQEQKIKKLERNLAKERRGVRRPARGRGRLPVGEVRFGDLRRLVPVSRNFGMSRGQPIDRYYIENFLGRHADDIRGRVLEIHDNSYTKRYGGSRVDSSEVLDVVEDNPQATIVADITHADHVPSDSFDCIIFTQTLHLIYDVRSAVQTLERILKPSGVLLATFPGISQISCRGCSDHWCWAFTQLSARLLFTEAFKTENIEVESHGNVLTAIAFLHGLATEELRQKELDHHDPDYEFLITLRAVKPRA